MNICLRCGKDFSRQDSLKRHLRNKKVFISKFLDIPRETMEENYEQNLKLIEKMRGIQKVSFGINPPTNQVSFGINSPQLGINLVSLSNNSQEPDDNVTKEIYKCEYCDKGYTRKNNYYRHRKNICVPKEEKCQAEQQQIIEQLMELSSQMSEMKNEHNLEKEELKNKIEELESKLVVTHGSTNNGTINNQHATNINNNNVTINITNYGSEDLSHMTVQDWETILGKEFDMLPNFVEYIHIDNEENRNIYVPSVKNAVALIWKNNKWVALDKKAFITKMLIDKRLQLQEAINTHGDDFTNVNKNRAQAVFDYVNNDEDELKRIKNETTLMLTSNKDEVKNTYEKNYGKKITI